MSQLRNPFEPAPLPPTALPPLLEMPSVVFLPAHSDERSDVLGPPVRFSRPPFHPLSQEHVPAIIEEPGAPLIPRPEAERRIRSLRKSPGFSLLTESALLLKAYQLDMDVPPPRRHYVRERLLRLLAQLTGASPDPDQLHITFTTDDRPSVDENGQECYSRRLSLTDIAQACFDPWDYGGLARVRVVDAPLSPDYPSLRASMVLGLITEASWPADYETRFERFWKRHHVNYRTLSRLSFLDALGRKLTRGQISAGGYRLALDALGLDAFPDDIAILETSGRGKMAEVWGLSLNGSLIPGVFQVRSKQTSHCFIHVAGVRGRTIEYICDDPARMSRRLLDAINGSHWHRQVLDMLEKDDATPPIIEASLIHGDVFHALTSAHSHIVFESLGHADFDRLDMLKPVARAMTLAGAVDFWPTHTPVLEMIPEPSRCAAKLMGDFLDKHYGLALNADHVFIAYRHGQAQTPLGDSRRPTNSVLIPDDKPVSLSEALITHYQVQRPEGYIDHGGRTVVYLDTTGKGTWSADRALPIDPAAVEAHIRQLDFLTVMSGYIRDFWEQKAESIERAFSSVFIRQALIALKKGHLTRTSFDEIVKAVEQPAPRQWTAVGFHVQGSTISSLRPLYPGLLILEQSRGPRVLYQAGHTDAFVELHSNEDFHRHLRRATANKDWRESVMRYIPVRHHDRLDYLLRLWSGVLAPTPPVSLLRPWTDTAYNADTRQALSNSRIESRLDRPVFGFLRELLKRNALEDAQDRIVTTAEVSLRYWASWLNHLRLLLAPMSILLTPAFMASLAAELGDTGLGIALANLPGGRYEEKKQAVLSALSLGLLSIGPQTPRIVRSLSRVTKTAGKAVRTGAEMNKGSAQLTSLARRATPSRQTRMEKFFHTDAMLKRWTIPGHPRFGNLSVHAWKLGRKFLLWTSDRGQARTLVVSTHGHYMPWSSTTRIPLGTEIHTYAPHGYILVDPKLHRVVNKTAKPFAISTASDNTLTAGPSALPPLTNTDKIIAGTSLRGRIKNYTLSKYQNTRGETYEEIGHIVRHSHASPYHGQLPATPMDVLTVRNRFGMSAPTLANLFDTLYSLGIHYDKILLVHCRCSAIAALMQRAPIHMGAEMFFDPNPLPDFRGQLPDTFRHDFIDRS